MSKPCFFYHAPCPDGMGAALSAYIKYGDDAIYIGIPAGADPLPAIPEGTTHVYFLDVSRPIPVLQDLADKYRVTVIDHHKTFADALDAMQKDGVPPKFEWVFDSEQSGAVLTWRHFFDDRMVPPLLRYVEDRDLWKWNMPDSKAINAAISLHPLTLDAWWDLYVDWYRISDALRTEGMAILKYQRKLVEAICDGAVEEDLEYRGNKVPTVNAPAMLVSEVGHTLLNRFPDAPYVMMYRYVGDHIYVSLRSEDHRQDVEEVARRYGGGGHRNAAGFTIYPKDER